MVLIETASGRTFFELHRVFRRAIGYQTPKGKENAFRQQYNDLEKAV